MDQTFRTFPEIRDSYGDKVEVSARMLQSNEFTPGRVYLDTQAFTSTLTVEQSKRLRRALKDAEKFLKEEAKRNG